MISVYSREEAIEDGMIVDATEYINSLNLPVTRFDKLFITTHLFEDLTMLETRNTIDTLMDLIDFGVKTDHDVKLVQHFHLPKEKTKIKSSEENGKYILELCYASED
jgi:hypothetical protein